jgi:phosphopantetheinyl transferase
MPLVYQHNINEGTKLGVWQITETEAFFLQRVPVKQDVSHPHKRLQHLAGRYLLPVLFPDFPLEEILIADTRKPFLENERYHFSISHCGDYAAAIVSRSNRVGVDIELLTPKIARIKHKFVSEDDFAVLNSQSPVTGSQFPVPEAEEWRRLTLLWSCKEAIFKWYGSGQVDFRRHIRLLGPVLWDAREWQEISFLLTRVKNQPLTLNARFLDNLVLAWLCTS